MLLPDVNVLVYAFRAEHPQHAAFRTWLGELVNGSGAYGMSDQVLSGFVRVVTHPKVFARPDSVEEALSFVAVLREQSNCVRLVPGDRHWAIFADLCARTQAKGNLVADAFLAALAIEHGCEWITEDRDYARFPGLRWRHPLQK
ncbi:MAG: type II toxin-antitoxin system VapC family toxin [Planctomycetota bacterium]|nr:type II toxin-antitoxin system VapC family toxin [Planctomycetota bacterium]